MVSVDLAFSHFGSIFFFVDTARPFLFLSIYMARIYTTARKPTLSLRRRKNRLLSEHKVYPDSLRASFVQRFSRCGKSQCHCRHGGDKHGPFHYLTQCLAVGQIKKFLLKTPTQQQAAREGIEHYRHFHEQLEELSQINAELLRRGEPLGSE